MKALVYLGPRRMEMQDVPEPAPDDGEVRVRVGAAAICGSDLHGFREASPRRIPPLVMGHEVAGVVDAVGPGADDALVGARVIAMPVVSCGSCARCREGAANLCPERRLMGMSFPGAFAEAFTLPAPQLLTIPQGLPDDIASLAEPLANAIHTVGRSVRVGDTVLVIGAGPIGLFAARAATLAGASAVFAADPVPDRLRLAREMGVRPVRPDEAAGEIAGATAGVGADVVIDAAGFPATWTLSLEAVRNGGRIEAVGLGAVEGPVSYQTLVAKGVTVTGSYACVRDDFVQALALLGDGSVDVRSWITTMPLTEGQAAFEALVDEGPATKVVLVP